MWWRTSRIKDARNEFGVAGTVVSEWSDSGSAGDRSHRRVGAVVRGVWWGWQHFGNAVVRGCSWIDAPDAPERITKLTAAMKMRVAGIMATRPVLRAVIIYALWNDETAAVGRPTRMNVTDGTSACRPRSGGEQSVGACQILQHHIAVVFA